MLFYLVVFYLCNFIILYILSSVSSVSVIRLCLKNVCKLFFPLISAFFFSEKIFIMVQIKAKESFLTSLLDVLGKVCLIGPNRLVHPMAYIESN